MSSSPSSRFEELLDDETPAAQPPHAQSTRPLPAQHPPKGDAAGDGQLSDGSGSEDEFEDSVWWTPSEIRDILDRAQDLKKRGNAEFGQGRWEMALETYKEGLAELPVRTAPGHSLKGKEKAADQDAPADEPEEGKTEAKGEEDEEKETEELRELRAILSANVAACLLKLERYEEAVAACDEALEEKPSYTKALHRRALANEQIGSWSSLAASLEDFKTLSTHSDLTPLLADQIRDAQKRLPPKIVKQQEKEKDEVIGKLKDLGNTVLGKFGLHTDNFKFVEQPGGGYSMAFQR
ncbi:hypothetical protein JCM10207_006355 [Rhodosporidiobolus poonsookiae]